MPNNKKHGGLQMRINNNLMALNAHRYMSSANAKQSKSLEKLSSGLAINSAADNAAGLAISEKMRAQINGLEQAQSNAQDGISMIQTAEGALQETENILQRMRELAVQSSNDTNTAEDRGEIQKEIDQLSSEITRISESTEFNTKKLLDGSLTGKLHIGANEGQDLSVAINAMDAETLGVSGDGEGKATFELVTTTTTAATGDIDTVGIVEGENVLNVVEVDNITVDGQVANYGLTNDDGKIVAVSTDAKTFDLLDDAYATGDLATADVDAAGLFTFAETVETGTVTFDADSAGAMTNITASAASIDVEGLSTGDYSVADFDSTEHLTDLTLSTSGTDDVADLIDQVVLNSDNEVVAVSFTSSTDSIENTSANEFYAVSDIELEADSFAATVYSGIVGADVDPVMTSANLSDGDSISIKASGGIDVSSQEAASAAITTLNTAINDVSAERANLGSIQNRLDHTINNLSTTAENMTASESRIRDVDMAKEMMEYTKLGILQQASQAMLAQANQAPQGVLQLLQ